MKLKIKKQDIVEVLSKIQAIAGRKTNITITTAVLIKTNKKVLILFQQILKQDLKVFIRPQLKKKDPLQLMQENYLK